MTQHRSSPPRCRSGSLVQGADKTEQKLPNPSPPLLAAALDATWAFGWGATEWWCQWAGRSWSSTPLCLRRRLWRRWRAWRWPLLFDRDARWSTYRKWGVQATRIWNNTWNQKQYIYVPLSFNNEIETALRLFLTEYNLSPKTNDGLTITAKCILSSELMWIWQFWLISKCKWAKSSVYIHSKPFSLTLT